MTPEEEQTALKDDVLHQALTLFRYTASATAAAVNRLKAMEAKLIKTLSRPLDRVTKAITKEVIAEADAAIADTYTLIQNEISFADVGEIVAKSTGQSLQIVLGSEAKGLTDAYFKSLQSNVLIEGSPAADWWAAQSDDVKFKFAGQVRQGLANAETNQQIIARIVGKNGAPGIMDVARRDAAALVQTSVQAVANDARLSVFQNNADILQGVRQLSTLDSHTSLICIAYSNCEWDLEGNPINGTTLPFNGGPPRHFNCRSLLVGISKNATLRNRQGNRASDEGPIDRKISFDDFLKRKSPEYVDEMLGKGRADLWRSGSITLKDLVNGQGRPLTLKELQAKFE